MLSHDFFEQIPLLNHLDHLNFCRYPHVFKKHPLNFSEKIHAQKFYPNFFNDILIHQIERLDERQ